MRKCLFLMFFVVLILSSCVSERKWITQEAKIVDITYYCEPVFYRDGTYKSETLAYFVLDNGVKVPMPKNFNPSLPEQYMGKTMTYTYSSNIKLEESSTPAADEQGDTNNYKYICVKKYMSEKKCIIRYCTKSNPALKTVQVSEEVYNHAREGFYLETDEFEPFVQKKKK